MKWESGLKEAEGGSMCNVGSYIAHVSTNFLYMHTILCPSTISLSVEHSFPPASGYHATISAPHMVSTVVHVNVIGWLVIGS